MKFESAVISLENQNIAAGHMLCAVSESPAGSKNVFEDSPISEELCENLIKHNVLKETPHGIIYSGNVRPQDSVALDNSGGKNIKIKVDGRILEEISVQRAYREAHKGAVYLHNGASYVIQDLVLEEGSAYAVKQEVDYYTETLKNEEVRIMKVKKSRDFGNCKLFTGNVSVTETYKGFRMKKGGNMVSYEELLLPPLHFNSEAVWIELNYGMKEKINDLKLDFDGAIHAAEHALIALSPLFAMCDTDDLGGMSYPAYEDGNPVIFIYDGYEGGIGISDKLYEVYDRLCEKTLEMIEKCGCEKGCPSCVYAAQCGNANNPIDKQGAVELIKTILNS
jgi:DEAD/DEAH box helicase domain-containing protein